MANEEGKSQPPSEASASAPSLPPYPPMGDLSELTAEQKLVKIQEIDERLQKLTAQKRWSEVIRALLAKADLNDDSLIKIELLSEAGRLYLERSNNHAESIKCFERVLEIDDGNREAIVALKDMYERRRDWEKLIKVVQREIELIPVAEERNLRRVELARLAMERVRKPEVCAALWQEVLKEEPLHREALGQLSSLLERARDWPGLVATLEQLVEITADETELKQLLQKLGIVYAEKVDDAHASMRVYRRLLQLDPSDRRAEEQLKRRFVAARAWQELEEYYGGSEKWDELIRIYEREAEAPNIDDVDKVALWMRAANIWQTQKGKPERAARLFERVREVEPDHLLASRALLPMYEAGKDAAKLAEVYEVCLRAVENEEEQLDLLVKLATLLQDQLKEKNTAFNRFLQAFRLNPYQVEVRTRLEDLANETDQRQELGVVYLSMVDQVDAATALEMQICLADMFAKSGMVDQAIEHYEKVHKIRPEEHRIADALAKLYRQAGKFDRLLAVLDEGIHSELDVDRRRQQVLAKASLYESELDDAARAVEVYEEVLRDSGGQDREALQALGRIFAKQEQWQRLADVLEMQVDFEEKEEDILAIKLQLARLFELKLQQSPRAIELYRDITVLAPDDSVSVQELTKFLDDAAVAHEAAVVLEPIFESRGRWQDLVKVLRVLAQHAAFPDARVAYMLKVVDVLSRRLAEKEAAFSEAAQLLRDVPANEDTLVQLESLSVDQSRFEELAQILLQVSSQVQEKNRDTELSARLLRKAAETYDFHLQDIDQAVAAYGRILDLGASQPLEILTQMEAIYRRSQRWLDLIATLRRRLELLSDDRDKREVLLDIAEIQENVLADRRDAIVTYKELLELDPQHERSLQSLTRLFEVEQLWSELADNISKQLVSIEEPRRRIEALLHLARIQEERMASADSAVDIYRAVLEQDNQNSTAVAALERLLRMVDNKLPIVLALESVYIAQNDVEKLIGIYSIEAQSSGSPQRRLELMHRIAELYETSLEDNDKAFEMYAQALRDDPLNSFTLDQLERLGRAPRMVSLLTQVYEDLVGTLDDSAQQVALHMRVADVYESEMDQADASIVHYAQALALDPHNLEAANALLRLYKLGEKYAELCRIYIQKAEIVSSIDEKKEQLFAAAAVYENVIGDDAQAVAVYRRVLALEEDNLEAIDKLVELHLKLENWVQLLEVYQIKADVVSDVEEKKRLYMEVAAVYEREIGDVDRAISTYQQVLDLDPDDPVAIARLDVLYFSSANWQELLGILEKEADLAADDLEMVGHRYRMAEIWAEKLGKPAQSVEILQEIIGINPDHEPAIRLLEQLLQREAEPVAASLVLEKVYEGQLQWGKLVPVLEARLKHQNDAYQSVELLHRIGTLYESELGDLPNAFEAFGRSLYFDLQHDVSLRSLERLATLAGDWQPLAALYDDVLRRQTAADPASRMAIARRTASLYEEQLHDLGAAIERHRFILEMEPEDHESVRALDRLYEAVEDWSSLAGIIKQELTLPSSDAEAVQLRYRLGQLYQRSLERPREAIEQYREVLFLSSNHAPAIEALEQLFQTGFEPLLIADILEPLHRAEDDWEGVIRMLQSRLSGLRDAEERAALMHQIAQIAENYLHDHVSAFAWLRLILLEVPTDERAVEELERLAQLLDAWVTLAHVYAAVLEQTEDVAAKLPIARRLARIYEDELGDENKAEETYRYLVGLHGDDRDALAALDRIYELYGAHEALAEVLRRRCGVEEESLLAVELAYRWGQVLQHDLRRADEAVTVYQHLLQQIDAHHVESLKALQGIYAHRQQWTDLYKTLEAESSITVDEDSQLEILGKMAQLAAEKLGDAQTAVEILRRVIDLHGEDLQALNSLGDIYVKHENWTDLVDVLEREAAAENDDSIRAAIYSDLGHVWYRKLQRDRSALDSWERVLDIEPASATALLQIANVHREGGATIELADSLQRLVASCSSSLEPARLEDICTYMGSLYALELNQPLDAIEVYHQVLSINPRSRVALNALEHLYKAEEQWDVVIDVMQQRSMVLVEPTDRLNALFAAANLAEGKLGDARKCIEVYQQILEIVPSNDFAFIRLERLLQSLDDWDALIEAYLARAEILVESRQRIEVLRKIAGVYVDQLHEPEKAFDALQLAWSEDVTNTTTVADLEKVAGPAQRWNELLTGANEALQRTKDAKIRVALCLQCGRWYGKELGHPEYAIPYYQQILAVDPRNGEAMRQMAEMYRLMRQWPMMTQVLARLVELTRDKVERAGGYVQLGDLFEQQLNDPKRARDYYMEATKVDPLHLPALDALERIYRRTQSGEELIAVMAAKAEALAQSDSAIEAKLDLARAYEEEMNEPIKAIKTYEDALRVEPLNKTALARLERLYTTERNWPDLSRILEGQLEIAESARDRVEILLRLGEMLAVEFIRPDRAIERYEEVLDIDPTHLVALQQLDQLYRQLRQWDKLVDNLDRHVNAQPDRHAKVELLKAMGEVEAAQRGAVDRAIDAYLAAINLDPYEPQALEELAKLYERNGDYSAAYDMLQQLEKISDDAKQRVLLLSQIGRILGEYLGDSVGAMEMYQRALDMDAEHLPTLAALRQIHLANSDWVAAASVLEKEAKVEPTPRLAAARLVTLGDLHHRYLDEESEAVRCYEAALAKDSENEEAALPLARFYHREDRLQEALPLLRTLLKRVAKRSEDEQKELSFLLGDAALRLGHHQEAVDSYARASQLDANHLPSLLGLSAAYFACQQWDQAFKHYQLLLVHHRDAMSSEEVADVFYHLGKIKAEQGERRKALNMFDKALEEAPHHRDTIAALVDLYEQQREWEQAIQCKRRLLDVATEEESFEILVSIGDLWQEKLHNHAQAISSYLDALEFRPGDHVTLHKLLATYQATKQWHEAIDVLERIAAVDERPLAKAKLAYTIGVVLRDELQSPDEALEKFDAALDLDFEQLKAFEAINKILTQNKDWKQLERFFRKMIHRVVGKGKPELEFNLWHTLGLVYRDRLRDFESAAEAFQMASRLQPQEMTEHKILAEIFAAIPGRTADAIAEHQWMLQHDPNDVSAYQALYRLYFDTSAYDKAWCVASTLVFLQKADKEQQNFFGQYRQEGVIRPKSRLDQEAWLKYVCHPREDLYVGKVFETLAPPLHLLRASSDRALGLLKKNEVDPSTSTATVARTLGFAAQVLGAPVVPRLFVRPDLAGGFAHVAGSHPPAMVCGSALLSGRTPQDLAFIVGRFLCFYRPEHFVHLLLGSSSELMTLFLAGMRLLGMGPDVPEVVQTAEQLGKQLQPAALESLRSVYRRLLDSEDHTEVNMKRWLRALELTGCRAGFLLCGDLQTAAQMVHGMPPEMGVDLPAKEKLKEMVIFSVSESYFALREILGIQIQV